jgi:hypothetical protein
MGMSTLSGLVAALVAAATSSATAQHPVVLAAQHVAPLAHIRVLSPEVDRRALTCSVRGSNSQTSRVERQVGPVACEQPPRSKVILTLEGGLFGSGR